MSDLLLELLLDVVSVDVVRVEVSEDQELVSEESVVPLEVDAAAELELVVESRVEVVSRELTLVVVESRVEDAEVEDESASEEVTAVVVVSEDDEEEEEEEVEDEVDKSEAEVDEAEDEETTSDEDVVVALVVSEDDDGDATTNFAPQT